MVTVVTELLKELLKELLTSMFQFGSSTHPHCSFDPVIAWMEWEPFTTKTVATSAPSTEPKQQDGTSFAHGARPPNPQSTDTLQSGLTAMTIGWLIGQKWGA